VKILMVKIPAIISPAIHPVTKRKLFLAMFHGENHPVLSAQ
jgi:hypothetical protein